MATLKVFKETSLPGALQANSIYMVAPAGSPNYVEMYVTGNDPATVRRIIKESDIEAMVSAAVAGISSIKVVDDITARDALTPTENQMCLVTDASADPTVNSGAATYVYDFDIATWVKIAEYESLDVTLSWSDIDGKPTSSAASIDSAVAASHSHTNKTQLDKIDQDASGNVTYNGSLPHVGWDSANW